VKYSLLAGFTLAACVNAYAEEACATLSSNGGITSLIVKESFSPADVGNNATPAWREIASEAQELYGNRVAYDTEVINLQVVAGALGVYTTFNFPMNYNGQTSIEKAILNFRGIDTNQADPNPCDPDKNETNNQSSSSGGGGGYGGGYGGSGFFTFPTGIPIWVNGVCMNCGDMPDTEIIITQQSY
jgi:hypothetical protein